jgi:murein DD-endopeptidase
MNSSKMKCIIDAPGDSIPMFNHWPRTARSRYHQLACLLAATLGSLFFPLSAPAQSHSGFPVDIAPGPAPQPFHADGHTHLLYELHLTNFAPISIQLTALDVLGDSPAPLAVYHSDALTKIVIPVEKLAAAESPSGTGLQTIAEGRTVIIFVDLTLDSAVPTPKVLHHRFSFSVARQGKPYYEATLEGPCVSLLSDPVPVLRPPLRGHGWIAFNALGASDHRRSLNAVDGRERIPQRFAIDWMRLGPDGALFHGDRKSNLNFYDYGAEVLAVANGRVSALYDGLPEYNGTTERSSRSVTIDNAIGNFVILDLGQSRFAVYAHLQPGSFRVKVGDSVKAGQLLALLGNSGNSDEPHLHFQLVNANAPMASEGVPYEFDTFTQLGFVPADEAVQNNGGPLLAKSQENPVTRHQEFPLNNAAVSFP